MASWYKQQLLDWVANLDVKADIVIDIGGSQDPIKGRTKGWDVKHYYILDMEQPHYGVQPDYRINLGERMYNTTLLKFGGEANLIFCLEVFDYIRNPMLAFEHIATLLASGGSAWVSFPFIYPHHNPIEDEGLRYTEPAIRYYGDKFGMPVQDIIYRRSRSPLLLQYFSEDGFRSAPNWDHNVIGYIVRFKK